MKSFKSFILEQSVVAFTFLNIIVALVYAVMLGKAFELRDNNPNGFMIIFMVMIVGLPVFAGFWIARAKRYISSCRFRNSELGKQLQEYVDTVLTNNAELKERVRHVTIGMIDSDIFQGYSKRKNKIYISSAWFHAAITSNTNLEMAKTTICHELGHLLDNSYVTAVKYWFSYCIKPTPWGKRIVWKKEFAADYYGARFYGNSAMVINKMQFLQHLYEKKEPSTIQDHPSWSLRIHAVQHNLKYSSVDVKKIIKAYRAHIKKKSSV